MWGKQAKDRNKSNYLLNNMSKEHGAKGTFQ